jgi:cyanate permease
VSHARGIDNERSRDGFVGIVTLHSAEWCPNMTDKESEMVAFVVLLLLVVLLGGFGFAAHFLWFVLIAAVVLWLLGFVIGGAERGIGGRRRWYGRW